MKILGIDTTATVGTVALTDNGRTAAFFTTDTGNTHSTTLLPMIETVMKVAGISPKDIDLYAVAAGPGSFTGVRIGCAAVKGLAFPYGTPCVGVSSLAAMAENFVTYKGIVCPVINARRDQVYSALFRVDGESAPRRLSDDDIVPLSLLGEILAGYKDESIYFTGDAYELALSRAGLAATSPEAIKRQFAVGVASLAERVFKQSTGAERDMMTAENLSVIYLRKPQAEREREEKLAAKKINDKE
ncbi:MAG: tRNA (adenosine(37)-N6)-threonylcarbamoyltransferase complex dimerization subunit type 1 TsaB [Clostridia bacterium]|nr:tRNA (adenosine(37)-N6)-threonylcarbamoyltransferase complex dimerization subunit type 1 TsaB [Clostridia bacterium]